MRLVAQLLHGLTDEYRHQSEQQCFVAHEFIDVDIHNRLSKALKLSNLQPYFADSEVTGNLLLKKICGKILATRAFVVDLSKPNPNVYFELGLAVGLNKPILALAKQGSDIPEILIDLLGLRFAHYFQLEQELSRQMPVWFASATETEALYTSHCHFLNRFCDARNRLSPRRVYYLMDENEGSDNRKQTATTGVDPDLREVLLSAFRRFNFDLEQFETAPNVDDYRFCDICRASREAAFGVVNVSQHTAASVYLFAGLFFGLGIDLLLLVRTPDEQGKEVTVPSLLRGLDYLPYQHFAELEERLPKQLEEFLNRQTRPLIDRVLMDLATDEPDNPTGTVLVWSVMKAGEDHARLVLEHAQEMVSDGSPRILAYLYIGTGSAILSTIETYLEHALSGYEPFIDAHMVRISWPRSFNSKTLQRAVLDGFRAKSMSEISLKLEESAGGPGSLRRSIWMRPRLLKDPRNLHSSLAAYLSWLDGNFITSLPQHTHVVTQLFIQTRNPAAFSNSIVDMLRSTHLAPRSVIRIASDIEDTSASRERWQSYLFDEQQCG